MWPAAGVTPAMPAILRELGVLGHVGQKVIGRHVRCQCNTAAYSAIEHRDRRNELLVNKFKRVRL
jgi:hypothetical protein